MQDAFSQWNTYLRIYGINLSFNSTSNQSNADIIITMGTTGGPYGIVTYEYINSTTYSKAKMKINDRLIHEHSNGNILNGVGIYSIMMHEIGHTISLRNIKEETAQYSVMVDNIKSIYFSTHPTELDITNIKKVY